MDNINQPEERRIHVKLQNFGSSRVTTVCTNKIVFQCYILKAAPMWCGGCIILSVRA